MWLLGCCPAASLLAQALPLGSYQGSVSCLLLLLLEYLGLLGLCPGSSSPCTISVWVRVCLTYSSDLVPGWGGGHLCDDSLPLCSFIPKLPVNPLPFHPQGTSGLAFVSRSTLPLPSSDFSTPRAQVRKPFLKHPWLLAEETAWSAPRCAFNTPDAFPSASTPSSLPPTPSSRELLSFLQIPV